MNLSHEQRQQLDQEGYILLSQVLTPAQIADLCQQLENLWQAEGEKAGAENYIERNARRLANLADKGDIFRGIYAHPLIIAGIEAVMGPNVRLSMLNARDVPPGSDPEMPFHRDSDGNRGRDEQGYHSATAIWMLDPFTEENGATHLLPGTQSLPGRPADIDPKATTDPAEIIVEGRPGDVLLFNGHCWHTGGANRSPVHRRAILAHYMRADIPLRPDRRQYLRPESAAGLSPRERAILGLDDVR